MIENTIKVQADIGMLFEGIETLVFVGDTNEPIETIESYESLINKHLESYVARGVINAVHHDEIDGFITKLKSVHEYAEQQAKLLGWEAGA